MRYRFTSYHPASDAEAAVTDGTRLGGLPHWLEEPQWPVDPYENELAPFMGQFRVPAADGSGNGDRMVYLFAIGFSGEHATVVQPGGQVTESFEARAAATGPTDLDRVHLLRVDEEVDFSHVEREMEPVEDEDEDDREERLEELLEERQKDAAGSIRMNQLGGPDVVPVWLQNDDLPGEGWQLVAQLDSCQLPFDVNFGDTGVGYLFLSPDGKNAEFFFQSC
ncbi:DUF1963 domain-containing protein [Streptomyces capitiformicae]|uniref:DUF1963 domain-containing protein n=1 Tax=Streptomyces capitiformicae TaxID=2014920 RepID=A0A919GRA2_9ACTN|nr:DUF1963 domain-containing protein [Streptomyces capitiformicae]GHH88803.1 hypothetical protein GCM10017771_35630 [Streptomyces capitiformicae]